jgi:hypothetical protein
MIPCVKILGVASTVLFCVACTHQLVLRNTPVPVKQYARLGEPARVFVDRVNVPYLIKRQIGRKKNFAGDFLAWIKTDSDMSAWAENEINTFLARHGHTVVGNIREADYIIICDVLDIQADKHNRWDYNDTFSSSIDLKVTIKNVHEGVTVFDREYSTHFDIRRPKEQEASMPDENMLNYCLSMVFQKALEQIQLSR